MKKYIVGIVLLGIFSYSFWNIYKTDANQTNNTVYASYVPAGFYLPFVVMSQEKLLEKRGYDLELKKFADNSEMINLLINDGLDVTAQSSFTMFDVEEENPGLIQFIYGQYMKGYSFVVKKNSDIQSIADLKGKQIGTWSSPTAKKYIDLVLKSYGIKQDDYIVRRYGASEWQMQIESENVDALFGFDTGIARLVNSGEYIVLEKNYVNNMFKNYGERAFPLFNGGGFINKKLLLKDPAKAQAIRDALLEAISIINSKNFGNAVNLSETERDILSKINAPEDGFGSVEMDSFVLLDKHTSSVAKNTYDFLVKQGLLKGTLLSIENMFWSE